MGTDTREDSDGINKIDRIGAGGEIQAVGHLKVFEQEFVKSYAQASQIRNSLMK